MRPPGETYGVIGVGSLASAIVTGLCDGVGAPPSVLLSPRNAETAAGLAARFPTVTVAPDNQAVVDGSATVLVCLRQAQSPLLADLAWRPDHVVVSAVAGLPLARLVQLVGPAGQVARAVPMPEVASRASVTPVYPPLPPAVALFDRLGGTVPVEDGDQFEAIFTALGTVAPFFEYLGVLAGFMADHGVPAGAAQRLVADSFAGVLSTLAEADHSDFAELAKEYAPPGGGNAQFSAELHAAGVFDAMRGSLDTVHARLTAPD
jgi:pyrroline-5-carboxylate reductase